MNEPLRIIITGGGTGGHVYPGVVVAEEIIRLSPEARLLFVGAPRGLEADVIPRLGYDIRFVDVRYFHRRLTLKNITAVYKALAAVTAAKKIIRKFRPHAVVGTGGYVSGPVVLAAARLGVPTLIQEQNAYPGLTTRWLASRVNVVSVSHADAVKHISSRAHTVITGHPVRRAIFEADREQARRELGLSEEQQLVMVVGGSGGAQQLNQVVMEAAGNIVSQGDTVLVHATGARYFSWMEEDYGKLSISKQLRENIWLREYIDDMPSMLAACDLVVARAGGMMHELTAVGRPSLLVPSPNVADDHQLHNARSMAAAGAAVVVEEHNLNAQVLARQVTGLLADPSRLEKMAKAAADLGKPQAGQDIARMALKLARAQLD